MSTIEEREELTAPESEFVIPKEAIIESLRQQLAAKQAEIDRLMLEYCPNEMTPEQLEEWGRNQVPVKEQWK